MDKELNKLNNKDDLYKEYINYFKTTLILFFKWYVVFNYRSKF